MEESVHIENILHEPIMFVISDLERKFRVGDSVRVLDGSLVASHLKGKTGMVVQVDKDTVDVLDQSSEFEVSDSSTVILSLLMFLPVHRCNRFVGDIHWGHEQTGFRKCITRA
jgi:hypothetical protein